MQRDLLLGKDVVEGGPAAARVVLGVGAEQVLATDYAHVHAFIVHLVIAAWK